MTALTLLIAPRIGLSANLCHVYKFMGCAN